MQRENSIKEERHPENEQETSRTVTCACGALQVTLPGPPLEVHGCTCSDCRKRSGSLMTYSALYEMEAVSITGEYRSWRRVGNSGHWIETSFCPTCGVALFGGIEVFPDKIGIPAGCFPDPEFAPPAKVYWTSRKHRWFSLPNEVEAVDQQ